MVNNAKDYKKYARQPSFVSQKIFSKSFDAIHVIEPVITLHKPIYVGFSIVNLSKHLMYDFHYKYASQKDDAKMLFTDTDTDSLVDELKQIIFMKIFLKINIYLI